MTAEKPAYDVLGTMAERVERAIRQDILNGVIAPGERLRTAELSAKYGVSQIPVREALRQLEGDGLVVIESHKGAILRSVDRKFVADMHDARAALEVLLVRRAAANVTPEQAEDIRRRAWDYESAAASKDPNRMVEANRAFHRTIARIGDNPVAERIFEQGWELVTSIRFRYGFGATRVATIIEQHRRLVDAISRHDQELAVRIVQEHCDSAKDDLLARMDLSERG